MNKRKKKIDQNLEQKKEEHSDQKELEKLGSLSKTEETKTDSLIKSEEIPEGSSEKAKKDNLKKVTETADFKDKSGEVKNESLKEAENSASVPNSTQENLNQEKKEQSTRTEKSLSLPGNTTPTLTTESSASTENPTPTLTPESSSSTGSTTSNIQKDLNLAQNATATKQIKETAQITDDQKLYALKALNLQDAYVLLESGVIENLRLYGNISEIQLRKEEKTDRVYRNYIDDKGDAFTEVLSMLFPSSAGRLNTVGGGDSVINFSKMTKTKEEKIQLIAKCCAFLNDYRNDKTKDNFPKIVNSALNEKNDINDEFKKILDWLENNVFTVNTESNNTTIRAFSTCKNIIKDFEINKGNEVNAQNEIKSKTKDRNVGIEKRINEINEKLKYAEELEKKINWKKKI